MEHWYCAEVESVKTHISENDLKKRGFRTFNPTCLERRFVQRHRTHQTLVKPLFPGYLFILYDPYFQIWQRMLSARGVMGLVKGVGSEEPARVEPAAMRRLLDIGATGPLKDDRWMQAFAKGQSVQVSLGATSPWAGHKGTVDRSVKERVWVFLSLFGRQTTAEFSATALEAA